MFKFRFFMPTDVLHGENIVEKSGCEFARLGQKALIVTGRSSGKKSGALDEVLAVCKRERIDAAVFDQAENNPSLENVGVGAKVATDLGADFIVAIGGGSPLDAAKAIAVLATNSIAPIQLYEGKFANEPLPIIAIPTTAGTGSEVTPYSVLTVPDERTKKGFGDLRLFPKVAFLDPRYTMSLPEAITIDTAVDALSHLVEGYLAKRANLASDMLAEKGIRLFSECIPALTEKDFPIEIRNKLLVASTLGGMTISHTATAFVHALGYPLTYFHGIPHGQANGLLLAEYLTVTGIQFPERVKTVLSWLGFESVSPLRKLMHDFFGKPTILTEEQISSYAKKAMSTRNVANSIGDITESTLAKVLEKSLGETIIP